MLRPQRGLDNARRDGSDPYTEALREGCEGAHEAVDAMLGGVVDGYGKRRDLAGDGGDVDYGFGV